MSFFDLESQPGSTSPTVNRQDAALYEQLMSLNKNVNLLHKQLLLIGTRHDSHTLRSKIEMETMPHCENVRDRIEAMGGMVSSDKLVKDFTNLNEELQRSKRHYNELKLSNPLKKLQTSKLGNTTHSQDVSSASESMYVSMPIAGDENTPLLQQQQDQQQQQQQQQIQQQNTAALSQDELDFHSIIQQERSQEISRIHSAVQEVNAIFHQLGTLVQEQGEQVDTIDNNISGLGNNLQKANDQLANAERYQRKKNRCGMITLVVIIVVTLIVILAVLS